MPQQFPEAERLRIALHVASEALRFYATGKWQGSVEVEHRGIYRMWDSGTRARSALRIIEETVGPMPGSTSGERGGER